VHHGGLESTTPTGVFMSKKTILGLITALMLTAPTVAHADVSFLEAGLFFLTGVEPDPTDQVSETRIVLAKYSMVAYRPDSNPCAIRMRMTVWPYTVYQMDFCQIVQYQWMPNPSFAANPGIGFSQASKPLFAAAN
jgi:hypothetical protein